MKKLTIAAIALAMGIVAIAPAQDMDMKMNGPWMMRKSSGNETADKLWWIADHTLNSAECDTLMTMLRRMNGAWGYVLQKAIVGAIESNSKDMSPGSSYTSMRDMEMNMKPMNYLEVYTAMEAAVSGNEKGVLSKIAGMSTVAQQEVIMKLVRKGGMSWAMWPMMK